jgi:hypothetical protein
MEVIMKIIIVIATVVVIAILLALPTMFLWNWLMPTIFGLIKINFWQALGINLLTGIFFKGGFSNSKNN